MKIATIICNFLLFGLVAMAFLKGNETNGTSNLVLRLVTLLVTAFNIVHLFGSKTSLYSLINNLNFRHSADRKIEKGYNYRYLKIIGVILNLILTGLLIRIVENENPAGNLVSGFFLFLVWGFFLFIILTPVLSLVMILASTPNKFEGFKRTAIITGISLFVIPFAFFLTMYIWIGQSIRENIKIAKELYPGSAEDALIAWLSDTTRSTQDRSSVAVWTLGQIGSKKALPVLCKLYKNDPEGKSCKGRHDSMICQREIHKAILKLENNGFTPYARLNK